MNISGCPCSLCAFIAKKAALLFFLNYDNFINKQPTVSQQRVSRKKWIESRDYSCCTAPGILIQNYIIQRCWILFNAVTCVPGAADRFTIGVAFLVVSDPDTVSPVPVFQFHTHLNFPALLRIEL